MRPRIATLDFARGIAIFGILLLNISAFGLPKAAYLNPAYAGQPSATDAWTWAVLDVLAQGKFLMMFAMLFGAGLQMLLPRGKAWIQSRLSLLLLCGLIHAVFFWDGDILLAYGLIGLVFWRLVREAKSNQSLFRTGVVLYLIGVGILMMLGLISTSKPDGFWQPGFAELQYEQFWRLKGGVEAINNRLDLLSSSLISVAVQYGWELGGAMLIGASLMRSGWLKGQFNVRHYLGVAAIMLPLSWGIQIPAVAIAWYTGWNYRWSGFYLQAPREIGALMQAIGYLALCYGCWPQLVKQRWVIWMSQVGRMALTNYLLQTLICTFFFNNLGFYQHFNRLQLVALVPAVWAVNLGVTLLWLSYFRQGPMEWLWRKLTAKAAGEV
ncbi:DUF418 domain-containing protein [Rouxiella sp. S1S-2]|uniref:DUF418 domain-containing protein YeiB n=1 Tax=Rouxiella sp. S1S-2 TaxID=2653856 RepID=UPI001263FAAC|nr:DUF418 domain-containing protein YeiB [Rouxiella sp. S1S-2]KAB7897761.1 DUF418 domain-containing protein [Rouxiella sp. S1S-2]